MDARADTESRPAISGHLVVAGCGYLGSEIARLALASGWSVTAITRSEASAAALRARGISGVAVDLSSPDAAQPVSKPDAIIHTISSGRGGADSYRAAYLESARTLAAWYPDSRLIFAGSTSVYAHTDGEAVDETSPAEPSRDTGRILLETEKLVLNTGGIVARLSGIYGPGRSALLRKYLDGTATLENGGTRWLNMIHRDDAAVAMFHLAATPAASGIYNVSDGHPVLQKSLYEFLSDQLNRPLPPRAPPDLTRKRGWTNKRISIAKLTATGWSPLFPTFFDAYAKQGLSLASP